MLSYSYSWILSVISVCWRMRSMNSCLHTPRHWQPLNKQLVPYVLLPKLCPSICDYCDECRYYLLDSGHNPFSHNKCFKRIEWVLVFHPFIELWQYIRDSVSTGVCLHIEVLVPIGWARTTGSCTNSGAACQKPVGNFRPISKPYL